MRKITFLLVVMAVMWTGIPTKAFALSNVPTTSPTTFASTPLQQTVSLTFTAGNGNKTLVVYSTSNNASSVAPTNGVTYAPGCLLSAGITVGYANTTTASASNTIVITGLSANTTYYFALYSYNDANGTLVNNSPNGSENYKTTSPLTGSTSTTSYNTAAMKSGVAGTWETAANWLVYNSGTSVWDVSAAIPATTTPTTVTSSYEPIVTTTASTWVNPSGIYMENGSSLSMKPGNATAYSTTSNLDVLSNTTIDGNGGSIILKPYTNNTYYVSSTSGVVNYRPGITNVSSLTYNINNAGTYKASKWTTCFNPTNIPNGLQLNVTSAVGTTAGSAGFAISDNTILSSAKVNLGDGVRLLRQYNGNSVSPYTTTVIGELSGSTNSTLEGQFVSGRYIYYYIGTLNTDATFNGKIKNYNASGDYLNLYKKGTGTWTLTADSHTGFVTGLFNVDAGKVILGASASLGGASVPVTVVSGATLQGTYGASIYGATTINGTLKGSLIFYSSLTLGSTATTNLSVNGYTSAGTDYDYINAAGMTVTNGGTLNITINALPSGDTSIKLINAGTYSGSFSTVLIKDGSGNTPVGFSYNPTTGYLTYSLAAPTTQTSNISTSNILQTSVNLSWTNGDGAKNLVLYSTNSDVATAYPPQDNSTYTVGSTTHAGYIVGSITGSNSATISGLTPGTQYYFAVFSYNDYNATGIERYLRTNPASGNATTAPNSNATDNFRTKVVSGRWDALSTWETSADGNTWYPSTMLPQDNTTSVTVKANANPITIGGDILPPTISTENGAKLKISRVFTSANWSFAPTISGSGSMTIQLDTVPNAKPYIYTINPTFSGLSTVNLVLNPLSDAVGIRIVGGGSNYNVGIGGSTQAISGLQFNVSTTKTTYQGFPLAADNYLQNAKLYVGDYVTVTRVNTQGSGTTNMYIGELSSNPTPSANPPKISGSATVSGRPLAFYIGSLNTDATYSGLFANSGGSDTYIHKVGTGNWTLTGSNSTFTGAVFADEGTVTLASGAGLGTVPVTISSGATFVVNSGATMPTGAFTIGTNGISGGTLNIPNNSTISNLTITSTSAPAVGTTINLVTATDPATITYTNSPVVPAGYSFNTTTGVLTYNGSSLASSTNISSAGLPSNASLTVLAGNTLTIDQNATINTITVAPGAKVTLNNGIALNVGSVIIQSSASGTATFVDADATGKTVTGTIQQYLPTGRNWYVGIPVSNADNSVTANNLTAGGATSVSYWDEPTGAWVNDYVGTLTKGMGYIAVSSSGSATNNISFTGTFNTGDLSVALTRTIGATKEGFNLIANPYPSYLNAMTAITNANSVTSTVEPTIWYRTKGSVYSFETVNTSSGVGTNGVTGYIPPMQAFWVRALSNTSLTFTNAMRYHANPSGVTTTVLKAPSNVQNSLVRLQVSNGTTSDETVIYSNANASNSFDNYDSRKMSNNSALVPEIYTTVGAEQLVINGLNEIPVNAEIPLGFNNLKTGVNNFTLRAAELRNLNTDTKVYLLDKSTNTETELTNSSAYTFSSDAINTTSRFSVIFKSVGQTTGTTNASDKKAIVYINSGHIVFVANEVPTGDNNSLMIFDAIGRKVVDRNITSSVTEINNINNAGVYVVHAAVNGQNYSAKINLTH